MSATKISVPQVAVAEAEERSQACCACSILWCGCDYFSPMPLLPPHCAHHASFMKYMQEFCRHGLLIGKRLECTLGMRAWNARRYCKGGGSGRDLELPGNKPCALHGVYKRIETIIPPSYRMAPTHARGHASDSSHTTVHRRRQDVFISASTRLFKVV